MGYRYINIAKLSRPSAQHPGVLHGLIAVALPALADQRAQPTRSCGPP